MAIDTGHGSSITFGTQGGTWRCTFIGGHSESRPVIDTTYHATATRRTNMPGDLLEVSNFTIRVQFQGNQGLPTMSAIPETITVTRPIASGETTAATIAGTGYVTRVKYPDLETNSLQIGEVEIQWDGNTGPTLTKSS